MNFSGYCFIAFVLFVVYEYVTYYFKRRQRIQAIKNELEDGCMPDEMVIVKWHGFELPMRYIEKVERWDYYSDKQKHRLAKMVKRDVTSNKINPDRLGRGHNLKVIEDVR